MEKICIVKRRREYTQTEVKLVLPDNLNDTFPKELATSNIAIDTHPEFSDKKTEVKLILPDNLSYNLPQEVATSNITIDTHPEFSDKKTEVKLVLPDKLTDNLPSEVAISSVGVKNHLEFSDKKIVEEFMDKSSSVISITMTKEQSELLKQSEYIKELLSGAKSDPSLDIKINPDGRISLNYHFNDSLLLRMLSPNQVCQMLQISRSFLQKIINEKKLNSYKLGRMRRFLLEDILEYLSSDVEVTQLNNKQ
ncbi:MAG: helix-turn-helix domain-containing protein [Smithella sp.]|jgi:excisionase family DNA binding protein